MPNGFSVDALLLKGLVDRDPFFSHPTSARFQPVITGRAVVIKAPSEIDFLLSAATPSGHRILRERPKCHVHVGRYFAPKSLGCQQLRREFVPPIWPTAKLRVQF
jgi:hypothetical protein